MMVTGLQEVAQGGLTPSKHLRACRYLSAPLLKPDLQAYGRKPCAKSCRVKSPFTIIKELINVQDDCFHTTNLPPNCRNILQAEASSRRDCQMHPQFKDPTAHEINKDPLVTNAMKARLAYLRIMINLNLLKHAKKGHKETETFWNQVNDNLATLLWNGVNTASNVSAQDTSLPTEAKIFAEMKTLTAKEKERVEVEEGALTYK
ncbi:hypothetical protein VP01_3169g1 [Puccinia sorghi]|uniref:Uncharacterized protein n=1 Tax=Puccinia sorghi TaxID=27349 RepID=A0A0L6UYW9_9BASI|nr:hypothetical protein VP01_3169g1 [Puccinia sorghi]